MITVFDLIKIHKSNDRYYLYFRYILLRYLTDEDNEQYSFFTKFCPDEIKENNQFTQLFKDNIGCSDLSTEDIFLKLKQGSLELTSSQAVVFALSYRN